MIRYFKVKQGNVIIDALADPKYIVYQQGNDLCVIGKESEAFGVLSRDASIIYAVEGMRVAPDKGFPLVRLEQIDQTEYDELIEELDDGGDVPEPDPDDPDPETVMTYAELCQKVLTLEAQNAELTAQGAELTAQNELLTGCVLELSELVC